MKKKVIKLSVENEFKLIGIATSFSTHKLSWLLNTRLNTDFKQTKDLILRSKDSEKDTNYSVYEYDTKSGITYSLIENNSNSGILIKQLNNIDYLLKIEGGFSDKNMEQLTKKIRETDHIIACLIIDIQNIKQKEIDLIS
ncbi:MAG: IPExxxVDY family protein [Bacteroidota bacterium]